MDGLQLTAEQVQTIAAGLYALAASDGADDREVAIIHEFVTDAGYPALCSELSTLHFDPAAAFQTLETSWLRRLFLKAALILVRADGVISDAERETFDWMSVAFGVTGGLDALLEETEGVTL